MRRSYQLLITVMLVLWIFLRTSPADAGEVRVPLGAYGTGLSLDVPVKSVKELREEGVVLQQLDYSCGSAALATIFTSYLEQPFSEAEIIDFIVRNGNMEKIMVRKGFSLLDLKRFAEAHDVQATGYGLDYDSLRELNVPVLVPLYREDVDMRHFVIFRGAIEDRVFLADPAIGRQTMMRSEFERLWSPKVGMVFTHPNVPPAAETPLGLGARDATFLSGDNLRAVVLQPVIQYLHNYLEF